jgi:hypothetical protein
MSSIGNNNNNNNNNRHPLQQFYPPVDIHHRRIRVNQQTHHLRFLMSLPLQITETNGPFIIRAQRRIHKSRITSSITSTSINNKTRKQIALTLHVE